MPDSELALECAVSNRRHECVFGNVQAVERDLGHFEGHQSFAHREPDFDPAAALQRGDYLAPRFVPMERIQAALERRAQAARARIEAEPVAVVDDAARDQRVDGLGERGAPRDGHDDAVGARGGSRGRLLLATCGKRPDEHQSSHSAVPFLVSR